MGCKEKRMEDKLERRIETEKKRLPSKIHKGPAGWAFVIGSEGGPAKKYPASGDGVIQINAPLN
jgi:hypothetical protein